jgi:hypothetical protein
MNRRILSTMAIAVTLFAGSAVYASPVTLHLPVQAKVGKIKQVKLNLRNDSSSPFKVMAGTSELTLAPGQLTAAKLNVGDKIVAEDGSATTPAGTVIAIVAEQLSDATIVVH